MTTAMSRRRKMSAGSPSADGIELWQQRSALQPPPRASARYSGHSWLQLDLESWLPLELEDPRTVRRVSNDGNLLSTEQEISEDATDKPRKKSYRFLLAFTALATVAFVSSLDATTLSVALPVSRSFSGSIAFLPAASANRCGALVDNLGRTPRNLTAVVLGQHILLADECPIPTCSYNLLRHIRT